MKVVLDTNVLVSGLMTRGGPCALILDLVADDRLATALDDRIMEEYERVCAEPRLRLNPTAVRDFLHFLDDCAERVTASPLIADLPDPDDRPFLEVAAEIGAILITGNQSHFPKKAAGSVRVLSPRAFLDLLRGPSTP
jgi:putative PIN family toxin of toxin-antitoxin system